jgi:hypothetical protein
MKRAPVNFITVCTDNLLVDSFIVDLAIKIPPGSWQIAQYPTSHTASAKRVMLSFEKDDGWFYDHKNGA